MSKPPFARARAHPTSSSSLHRGHFLYGHPSYSHLASLFPWWTSVPVFSRHIRFYGLLHPNDKTDETMCTRAHILYAECPKKKLNPNNIVSFSRVIYIRIAKDNVAECSVIYDVQTVNKYGNLNKLTCV